MSEGVYSMAKQSRQDGWLDSKEAAKELKVSACGLANIREAGKLLFTKEGNAFRYAKRDIQRLKHASAK